MIYVLAFPRFDTRVAESLARFRALHEPDRAQLVRPHVTLVFGLSGVAPEEFLGFCENAFSDARRIPVDFDRSVIGHDPFEDTHKLQLLCRHGQDDINTLHRQLYDGPHRRQFDPSHPYRAHMTVASNRDREALTGLDPSAIGAFPIAGVLDTVAVVSVRGGVLRTVKSFALSP